MLYIPLQTLLTETGGTWVIDVLLALSVLALAVILERWIIIRRQVRYQNRALPALTDALQSGGAGRRLLDAAPPDSLLFRLLNDLHDHAAQGHRSLERQLDTRLALERRSLEKHLVVLGTLGNNAPFIGLLGTVLGVIRAFHDLAASGGQGPEVVMQGISEALVATAVGILIALPCVVFYNALSRQIKSVLIDADRFGKQWIAAVETGRDSSDGR